MPRLSEVHILLLADELLIKQALARNTLAEILEVVLVMCIHMGRVKLWCLSGEQRLLTWEMWMKCDCICSFCLFSSISKVCVSLTGIYPCCTQTSF